MNCFNHDRKLKRKDEENRNYAMNVDLSGYRWTVDVELDNIVTRISENRRKGKHIEKSYRINFAVLQRIYLRRLKTKLAKQAAELRFEATEPVNWQETLGEYIQALQNYEYMEKRSLQAEDPFYMSGEKWLDRNLLERIIGDNADRISNENEFEAIGKWEKGHSDPDRVNDTRRGNYRRNWIEGFYQRLGVAAVAGIFLIVPMWLMVLHNTLWTALVSTTVFVAVFGLLAAVYLTSPMEVMSSTAAYAAVLVVFVGLITEMNSSD